MSTRKRKSPVHPVAVHAVGLVTTLALTACGAGSPGDGAPAAAPDAPSVTEVRSPAARLVVSHDGGVQVLDAVTGEVVAEETIEGYLRLNEAGDGRHVVVSGGGGFRALDTGAFTTDHGDHGHSYAADPVLGELLVEAAEPGHVVPHLGVTTLFDDATGEMTAFTSSELAGAGSERTDLALETTSTGEAHHGVGVLLPDGSALHTEGTVEARSSVVLRGPDGEEVARTDDCPGVHGEAFVGDVAALGCEDGVVLVPMEGSDGAARIEKVDSPDAYGRIGNQAGHETSPFLLGDYKTDPDAELERPTRVSVVDTRDGDLSLVELGTSYSFRSLGRTEDGDALVLGTDGSLHRIDPARASVSERLRVVAPWREPVDWQQPRPTLEVVGSTAYVTEPATREVHVVDLDRMRVAGTLALDVVPDEVQGVTG